MSRSGPFGIVPTAAIFDKRVSPALLRILAALTTHADHNRMCDPRQDILAERLGMTHQAVSKSCHKLVALGYLRIELRGFPARNFYRILFDQPDRSDATSEVATVNMRSSSVATSEVAPVATSEVATDTVYHSGLSRQKSSGARAGEKRESVLYEQTYRTDSCALTRKKATQNDDKTYAPDPLWVAFANEVPVPDTRAGRRSWSIALADLRNAGANAESVAVACRAYRQRWPKMTLTPFAIAKYWHMLKDGTNHGIAQTCPGTITVEPADYLLHQALAKQLEEELYGPRPGS